MSSNERVIKLVARPGAREVFQAVEGKPTLGDRSVFTHDLYLDGTKVGFDGGVCTVVKIDDESAYILCDVSMNLEDGTLSFQTFMEELFPPPPFHTAITGGTGSYGGARGEMHIDPASPDTHYYTLTLTTLD